MEGTWSAYYGGIETFLLSHIQNFVDKKMAEIKCQLGYAQFNYLKC